MHNDVWCVACRVRVHYQEYHYCCLCNSGGCSCCLEPRHELWWCPGCVQEAFESLTRPNLSDWYNSGPDAPTSSVPAQAVVLQPTLPQARRMDTPPRKAAPPPPPSPLMPSPQASPKSPPVKAPQPAAAVKAPLEKAPPVKAPPGKARQPETQQHPTSLGPQFLVPETPLGPQQRLPTDEWRADPWQC